MIRPLVLTLSILLISLQCFAQRKNPLLSNGAVAEKIYLQTDGSIYTVDQSLWFKAIVVNAANHRPTKLSGVLYVELIGENKLIKSRKVVKLKGGVGEGFFQLDPSYVSGRYQLRAYTHWNKNFDERFVFQQYIDVYESKQTKNQEIFEDVTLVTKGDETLIQATIKLNLIDSISENPLLKLNFDDDQDSLPIRASANGTYFLNYAVPKNVNMVTVGMSDATGSRYTRNVLINPDALDLQFFPESGELVQEQVSKVGFKALSVNGLGKEVSGEIINSEGSKVAEFKSNRLGMGSFTMLALDDQYKARVKSEIDPKVWLEYDLPPVAAEGTVMSVLKRDSVYYVNIASNVIKSDSLYLTAAMRGARYLFVGGTTSEEGQLRFKLPQQTFREGIIVFTLRDRNDKIVLERMVFNQSGKRHLKVAVNSAKEQYWPRERTQVTTQVTDVADNPVKANISYLVVNKDQLGDLQQNRQNIRSYLLFGSELEGNIEDPGYYFRPGIERTEELDALLLTQGWSKYKYQYDIPLANRFQPEYNLTVSGSIRAPLNAKKAKKDVDVTMMTFGSNSDTYKETSDEQGRFYFDVGDEYGQRMNVLIQTTSSKGKNRNYQLVLDENVPPPVDFAVSKPLTLEDSVVRVLIKKNEQRKQIEDAYRPIGEVRDLGEFVVEDYALTPERRKVAKDHGLPDIVISGEDIQAENKPWSYGLYSVLFWSFPQHIQFRTEYIRGNPFEKANVRGANFTMVTIDGIPVSIEDYPLIPSIPVSEVKSFEIMKAPDNFGRLFYRVYPTDSQLPAFPAIIAIYTHAGKGLYGTKETPGVIKKAVQVFSPTREFYKPKYAILSAQDWVKPDYRALVHWEPLVETDAAGRSVTSFYNADNTEEMMIVVEAIAEDGSIGYQEHSYQVIKRADRN